jgi:hypothetical protein
LCCIRYDIHVESVNGAEQKEKVKARQKLLPVAERERRLARGREKTDAAKLTL